MNLISLQMEVGAMDQEVCLVKKPSGWGPGQVAHLVRASSCYTKVVGLILGQGIYKKETNECMNE